MAVIVFWAFALEWLGYRFVHPHSLPLVRMVGKNMRRELLTEGKLRQQGVEDLDEVKEGASRAADASAWPPMDREGEQKIPRLQCA